ncbi:MAG: hypothetical protein ACE5FJ_08905, partial [Gemmatimonadales bacterium]
RHLGAQLKHQSVRHHAKDGLMVRPWRVIRVSSRAIVASSRGEGSKLMRVVFSALGRFLPGSVIVLGSIGLGMAVVDPFSFGLIQVGVLALEVAGLTIGFGVTVFAMIPWLRHDAAIHRRRSFVAGVCAPLGLAVASFLVQGVGLVGIAAASMLAGGLLGFVMFAPWLTRGHPPDATANERELESDRLTAIGSELEEQLEHYGPQESSTENAA